jgi:hypothetical protein
VDTSTAHHGTTSCAPPDLDHPRGASHPWDNWATWLRQVDAGVCLAGCLSPRLQSRPSADGRVSSNKPRTRASEPPRRQGRIDIFNAAGYVAFMSAASRSGAFSSGGWAHAMPFGERRRCRWCRADLGEEGHRTRRRLPLWRRYATAFRPPLPVFSRRGGPRRGFWP